MKKPPYEIKVRYHSLCSGCKREIRPGMQAFFFPKNLGRHKHSYLYCGECREKSVRHGNSPI